MALNEKAKSKIINRRASLMSPVLENQIESIPINSHKVLFDEKSSQLTKDENSVSPKNLIDKERSREL